MRTELHAGRPFDAEEANQLMDRVLASAQFAARCSIHKTYGVSPGSIVFHCDMLLPIPITTNLQLLREKRQAVIDKNNLTEN